LQYLFEFRDSALIMAVEGHGHVRILETLEPHGHHVFAQPTKKIHEGGDVQNFLATKAYTDLMTFLLQLNRAMFPRKTADGIQTWPLNSHHVDFSEPVRRLQLLLSKLDAIIVETPPDTGPRRFGNISFRKWYKLVEGRASDLIDECVLSGLLTDGSTGGKETVSAKTELIAYFLGSFGSAQRLDYGTGHELSFLAFLACIWKLHGFPKADPGVEERGIVLGVIEPCVVL
jgi:serine/threonine-protein phosphatase 2A activator